MTVARFARDGGKLRQPVGEVRLGRPICVRLEPKMHAQLESVARANGGTLTEAVRKILIAYLKRFP